MFSSPLFDRGADLRGVYPGEINETVAWYAGQTLVLCVRGKTGVDSPRILVGRDGRVSSPAIYRCLIKGIEDAGGVPISCGVCSTDLVQYGAGKNWEGAVAATMVTASHNPPEYNGIKSVLFDKERQIVDPIRPKVDLKPRLKETPEESQVPAECRAAESAPEPGDAETLPVDTETGVALRRSFVAAACDQAPGIDRAGGSVVFDPGNGAAVVLIEPVAEELRGRGASVKIDAIADELDGTFPSRPSNPGTPQAVQQLSNKVRETGAQFGVAFDGDADRAFMVDEKGEFVPGSQMLAALADAAIRSKKEDGIERCPVTFPAVGSWKVVETIRTAGGIPVMTRVGQDSLRDACMRTGAIFGGESSAHFNFPDTYLLDSGLFATMTFWNLLIESGKSPSELLQDFTIWPASGETNLRIQSDDWQGISTAIMETLAAEFRKPEQACFVLELDGVSVYSPGIAGEEESVFEAEGDAGALYRIIADGYTPDWMFNVRRSNNEPLLRLNVEAQEADQVPVRLNALIGTVEKICNDAGVSVEREA